MSASASVELMSYGTGYISPFECPCDIEIRVLVLLTSKVVWIEFAALKYM